MIKPLLDITVMELLSDVNMDGKSRKITGAL